MNQRIMRLLCGEEDFPELIPEVPENQATIVSRTEAMTSSLRAGWAKNLLQSPQTKIVKPIWTMSPKVEPIAIRGSGRTMSIGKTNPSSRQSERSNGVLALATQEASR